MQGAVKSPEIDHLAVHLEQWYEGPRLRDVLDRAGSPANKPAFRIPLSESPLSEGDVIHIGQVPVLFPMSAEKKWYTIRPEGVEFHHDILKGAFYLLSGYQEQQPEMYDRFGRFAWKNSIQQRLGFTGMAVVNHYFKILLDALEAYCRQAGQPFQRKGPGEPVLFLSHDIDRTRKYTFRNLVHISLQLGRRDYGGADFGGRVRRFRDHLTGWITSRKDPYRNFDDMLELEEALGIRSTWFLLEKRGGRNSKYRFTDPEIRTLLEKLDREGHEVGLHGTFESSGNATLLEGEYQRLGHAAGKEPRGCRQHFLRYRHPDSTRAQVAAGLVYDASLGFAEQPGFRHSYAHPFRLYDFEKQETLPLWHIPLTVMDSGLLEYMGVGVQELKDTMDPLLEEVRRWNGVFSLLWHNCRLDEEEYPGIGKAYMDILESILKSGFRPGRGIEIAKKES